MKLGVYFCVYSVLSLTLARNVVDAIAIWGDSEPSEPGEFPYYAQVFSACGGSLIAPDVILTAAHCLKFMEGDDVLKILKNPKKKLKKKKNKNWVLVGAMKRDEKTNDAKWRRVIDIEHHPKVSKGTLTDGGNMDYDLALLRLEKPYNLESSSVTLQLNMENDVPMVGDVLTLAGMGEGDFPNDKKNNNPEGTWVDYLHDAEAPYKYTNRICNGKEGKKAQDGVQMLDGSVTKREMCWSRCYEDLEICPGKGDSGGAVVKKMPGNVHLQVGIVSHGSNDGKTPDILVRVSKVCKFIQNIVCEEWKSMPSKSYLCANSCKKSKAYDLFSKS